MKLISYLWNKLGEENTGRNMLIAVTFMFFIAIFFTQELMYGIILVIFFIAYMTLVLSFDNKKI